jgi:hypothetical protein
MLDHPLSNDSNKVRVCPQIESEVSGEQRRLGYDMNAAAISTRVFTRNNPQDKLQLFVVFLAHGQNLLDESCDAFGSMKTPTVRRHGILGVVRVVSDFQKHLARGIAVRDNQHPVYI